MWPPFYFNQEHFLTKYSGCKPWLKTFLERGWKFDDTIAGNTIEAFSGGNIALGIFAIVSTVEQYYGKLGKPSNNIVLVFPWFL